MLIVGKHDKMGGMDYLPFYVFFKAKILFDTTPHKKHYGRWFSLEYGKFSFFRI